MTDNEAIVICLIMVNRSTTVCCFLQLMMRFPLKDIEWSAWHALFLQLVPMDVSHCHAMSAKKATKFSTSQTKNLEKYIVDLHNPTTY